MNCCKWHSIGWKDPGEFPKKDLITRFIITLVQCSISSQTLTNDYTQFQLHTEASRCINKYLSLILPNPRALRLPVPFQQGKIRLIKYISVDR